MHGKRKPYLLLLGACAFGALAVPLGLHWMWLEIDAHGGDATAAFAVTREKLGVPWWLLDRNPDGTPVAAA